MVAIAILVVVLIAVVAFFMSAGGGATAQTTLQRQFTEGCFTICPMPQRQDEGIVRATYASFDLWQRACEQVHGVQRGAYLQCLERCSCGTLPTACDRLQWAASNVGADCPYLCEAAINHPSTKLLYSGCQCTC